MKLYSDEHFMREAFKLAVRAYEQEEIPVGAVVVANNKLIGRGYNQVESLNDATAHAEMLAITAAQNYIGSKYLVDCTLYVTLEPCVMCAGALAWTQMGKLIYGAADPQKGFNSYGAKILHPKTKVVGGIMEKDCQSILLDFFKRMRN
ncbi:MAG TPA: nucleoside deaminase [Cytophagales bacterium]|nr:nucleoside deaminase [Cytophagales bacterium]